MRYHKLLFILQASLILFFLSAKPSFALSLTEINSNASIYDISDNIDIFIDEKQNLTIDEVIKDDLFSKNKIAKKKNYGYVNGAIWLKFELQNLDQENSSWVLEVEFLAYDDMVLYLPKEDGKYESVRSDLSMKFNERPIPHRHYMFPLTLQKGENKTFYLRVISKNIAIFPLKLRSAKDSVNKIKNEYYVFGLYYGAFLIIFLYNFCLSFGLKDKRYFDYSLFVLGLGLFQLAMNGFSFEFFWPEDSNKQYLAPLIAMSLFAPITINFVRSFINTKYYCSKIDNYLFATYPLTPLLIVSAIFTDPFGIVNFNYPLLGSFIVLFLPISIWFIMLKLAKKPQINSSKYSLGIFLISAIIVFFLFVLRRNFIIINNILFLLIISLSTIAAIKAVKQGSRQAYYFLISWSVFIFGVLLLILLGLGILPYNIITQNGWQIGAAFSVVLLSFGLADNFRSERVAKELAQQEAIDNLKKSDLVKDNVLSNVTHELRTPINAMLGLIDRVVSDDKKISEESVRHLKIATSSGRKLNLLINDILTTSQLKQDKIKLNLEPVAISMIIQNILSAMTPLALAKDIELINNCQSDLPKINADENRIYQVFYNLIGNAIKFNSHGFIVIEAEIVGDELAISVRDSGIGIDFDKLNDIFISFEQLQNSLTRGFEGNGLGLTIVKKLIEMHNGRIVVESKPNYGSKFTCFLPISVESVDRKNKESYLIKVFEEAVIPNQKLPEVRKTKIRSEPFTIFVIDDDPIHNYLVAAQLKGELGYNIVQIQDPKLAMKMIEEQVPDLILLDVMMPDISGFELCEEIRKKYSIQKLPIIFLTAKQESDDIVTGFKVGGNDYLTKPFFKEELQARVRHHLQSLLSKKRLASLQDFANQIGNFSDRNQLFAFTLEILYRNCNASKAMLFYEYKMLNAFSHKEGLDFEINEEINNLWQDRGDYKIFKLNNLVEADNIGRVLKNNSDELLGSHFVFLQIKGFEEYLILIWRQKQYHEFDESDLSYIDNIAWQICVIVKNSQKIILTPGLVKAVYEIEELKDSIVYIKSSAQYCDIYTKNKEDAKLMRIGIQTIDHYFDSKKLLRVHRSYLVNMAMISDLKKIGRDYYLLINHCGKEVQVPVGRGYAVKVRAMFEGVLNS
ncbi:MAG: response regulator [Rickettsiales bacterium]|nr:response regulator [Rickettsiales bacterium]